MEVHGIAIRCSIVIMLGFMLKHLNPHYSLNAQYTPSAAAAAIGGSMDECQRRVHAIFEEPSSLYVYDTFQFINHVKF